MYSGKSIMAAALIAITAGTAPAAEQYRGTTQAEITDMVLDELEQRSSADRNKRAEAAAAAGYVKDHIGDRKPADRLAGTGEEVEIKYDQTIDRNRAPGLIQMVVDAWDFLTGWYK